MSRDSGSDEKTTEARRELQIPARGARMLPVVVVAGLSVSS